MEFNGIQPRNDGQKKELTLQEQLGQVNGRLSTMETFQDLSWRPDTPEQSALYRERRRLESQIAGE